MIEVQNFYKFMIIHDTLVVELTMKRSLKDRSYSRGCQGFPKEFAVIA